MRIENGEDCSQDIFQKSYKLSDMFRGKFQAAMWFLPHKVHTVTYLYIMAEQAHQWNTNDWFRNYVSHFNILNLFLTLPYLLYILASFNGFSKS